MSREYFATKRQKGGEDDGVVHLPGLDSHDHATFCGQCWPGHTFEETTDRVTCRGCLAAAREALPLLRGTKRLGMWR